MLQILHATQQPVTNATYNNSIEAQKWYVQTHRLLCSKKAKTRTKNQTKPKPKQTNKKQANKKQEFKTHSALNVRHYNAKTGTQSEEIRSDATPIRPNTLTGLKMMPLWEQACSPYMEEEFIRLTKHGFWMARKILINITEIIKMADHIEQSRKVCTMSMSRLPEE